jgi:hypothetical protein
VQIQGSGLNVVVVVVGGAVVVDVVDVEVVDVVVVVPIIWTTLFSAQLAF